ncbi:MAG: CoA-binding protein [candidate division Zixibacteria bacterium]|nr:CoA-binding protein [candidate division Zixibacteria bacterium]
MTTVISPDGKWKNPSDEEIIHIYKTVKRIAVAGLSSDPARPSFGVAKFLLSKGYEIIPVNPNETEVLGQKAYPDLRAVYGERSRTIPGPIDLVDCFRRSEVVGETIDEGLALGIKNFWLQEGVWDEPRGFLIRQQGGFIVMNLCIAKTHARLMGQV